MLTRSWAAGSQGASRCVFQKGFGHQLRLHHSVDGTGTLTSLSEMSRWLACRGGRHPSHVSVTSLRQAQLDLFSVLLDLGLGNIQGRKCGVKSSQQVTLEQVFHVLGTIT